MPLTSLGPRQYLVETLRLEALTSANAEDDFLAVVCAFFAVFVHIMLISANFRPGKDR
jgi:hypothetical protein